MRAYVTGGFLSETLAFFMCTSNQIVIIFVCSWKCLHGKNRISKAYELCFLQRYFFLDILSSFSTLENIKKN